jgi:hypothetical protein
MVSFFYRVKERSGSQGADLKRKLKDKSHVQCAECGKEMLKVSLKKHRQDKHENTSKRQCNICSKYIAGSDFALKKHISAVHNKVSRA